MDGFGSNQRTLAVDRWMEIVNGKGYGVGGATRSDSSGLQSSIPPPPGAVTTAHTAAPASWRFIDPETKRKTRIATYKAYVMERKVKSTVKKGFRWMKNRCSQIING
ncbi:hypothetical protein EUTSA_v10006328mg [Eutrema salsugineum]|uniref:DUF3511 domain-containing protein n=1 Tax=Eutrema salsugineum TaxID=72664 RepID=V4LJ93_EUTSA|nr:uncharacterized protein LOC18019782 [Eutrema salsugineum]ESQ43814.1 hypothetical protein EUTSA_v10006328mg [Eutrema salsugineum]